jgi:hypothetical protein
MTRAAPAPVDMNSAPPHPGWLLVAPDHRPYAWYAYDQALSHDVMSATARFEPDAERRDAMLNNGWAVRVGRAVELVCSSSELAKASA